MIDHNYLDVVKFLIDKGVDPNEVNKNKSTPISFARTYEAVQLLMEYGAKPDGRDEVKISICKLVFELQLTKMSSS